MFNYTKLYWYNWVSGVAAAECNASAVKARIIAHTVCVCGGMRGGGMKVSTKVIGISTLAVAALLTALLFGMTRAAGETISDMQLRYPVLGVVWAVATAFATAFNLEVCRRSSGITSKLYIAVTVLGCALLVLTPFTMPKSVVGFTLDFVDLHLVCAVAFAATSYICLAAALFVRPCRHRAAYVLLGSGLLAVGVANVFAILSRGGRVYGLMEGVLIMCGFAVLFAVNYAIPFFAAHARRRGRR